MKKLKDQNVKGTQDYLPKDERIRRKVKKTLEDVFIQYGCQPLETPILNYSALMASKYAGGAEILEEMYTLSDRGERELALRYDLTIPFAKVVAMNPSLRMPFKRYEIGKVFRDGPIKAGRFREFTQCDVDIVGVSSQMAEAELMIMALDAFDDLGLEIEIQYNNRQLLVGMLKMFGTPEDKQNQVVLILDKLEKIGIDEVLKQLETLGLATGTIEDIRRFLTDENNNTFAYFAGLSNDNEEIDNGLKELKELTNYLTYLGVSEQCIFNPFLARGLDIYTGTIYEIFLKDQSISSSIGSGGRYNNAIGGLIGAEESFATVGISFGLDVIFTAIQKSEQDNQVILDYYIIPLQTEKESLRVARKLRKEGYMVEVEMTGRKLRKALDRANKENVRNVIVIGEEEVTKNELKIKDMDTGLETVQHFDF